MSEFRQDRTNGFWTIIAPERNWRPHELTANDTPEKPVPVRDAACPFCPGNEAALPPIIEEISSDTEPYWLARVVPNKFPILSAIGTSSVDALKDGQGLHEVIIESSRHILDLHDLSPIETRAVINLWHRRASNAVAQQGIETALVFHNQGRDAGASIRHSHSQLVAMPIVPPKLSHSLAWARQHFHEKNECATCREIELELASGDRVVEVTGEFVVLAPFAARNPLEQWIVPRLHGQSFLHTRAQDRAALAQVISRALRRFRSVASAAAYNLVIEPGSENDADAAAAHWAARIVPVLTKCGGFEILSGVIVNPSSPEEDARRLRDCHIERN